MCTVSPEPNRFICIFPPRMNGPCLLRPMEGPFDRVAVYLGRFFADWAEGGRRLDEETVWSGRRSSMREQATAVRISLYDNIPINAMIKEAFPSIDRGRGTKADPRLFK